MSKKSTRGGSANKIKKGLSLSMLSTALLTISFLFIINGLCISGEELKDMLIIFSSMMMICTTALFMTLWISD